MQQSALISGTELKSPTLQYKIESVLGQGSFGVTYKAKGFTVVKGALGEMKMELPNPIAIKEFFMRDINQRDDSGTITGMTKGSMAYNYALKFRKEAENLARMNHPNIIHVIDFIEANNTFYYVMEYIEGEDMNSYLKTHKLSEADAVSVIVDVANALKYMHEEQRMLHLDLKPGNIMRRKSDGHIFLIDFGLSKHYGEDGNPDTSTTVGLGTEGYAPLEQGKRTNNRNDFLPTIDVYALGATLFKLLTGNTPPAASDVLDDEDLLPAELEAAHVSQELIDIVVKAMKPGAKKRTQTVGEFMKMFETSSYKYFLSLDASSDSDVTLRLKETTDHKSPSVDEEATVIIEKPRTKVFEYGNYCKVNIDGIDYFFCRVEPGSFTIGEGASSASQMPHEVEITKPYYLGRTPVVQSLWVSVMGNNNSSNRGSSRPVEMVSWNDCQEFIARLNNLTGLKFRLPTEAEWEYAAKGGRKSCGFAFAGSDTIDDVAWYESNSMMMSHFVKQKQSNELGFHDMSGNVWEWCQDWNGQGGMKKQTDPHGPVSGDKKVIKGGCYYSSSQMCYPESRSQEMPNVAKQCIGFRIILEN